MSSQNQARAMTSPNSQSAPRRALVLSGGIALGAFEAGAFAALAEADRAAPDWIVAASIGAVNAALIAGNRPEDRVTALRSFWDLVASDPMPAFSALFGAPPPGGFWRRAYNDAAVLQSLLLGRPGLFRPRLVPGLGIGAAPAVYDLAPLIARLEQTVDFDRLNAGGLRISIVTTDVLSGERVIFDTARGTRIGPAHVAASGALLPVFSPVEVDGRLLADGGLASNTPLDLVLDEPGTAPLHCLTVELFVDAGPWPSRWGMSMMRAQDIAFSNQTARLLEGRAHTYRLRAKLDRLVTRLPADLLGDPDIQQVLADLPRPTGVATVARIFYRSGPDEAEPGKLFDFSRFTIAERWAAGERGMSAAIQRLPRPDLATELAPGLLLHSLEAGPRRSADI
ncbi:MAG TPA: patatin-like phospholipase family protein [Rhodopila sp.]|nr:patatin-like phospholipase family protein [Rhodopila sp.]